MKRIFTVFAAAVFIGSVAVSPAGATNGMNMIGFGTRAIGMGGADVALAGDAQSVSGNPAAVNQAAKSSATIGLTVLMPDLALTHNTPGGPDSVDGEAQYFTMPTLGYVHSVGGGPLALGFGLFAQGGMGVDFQGVQTGMGGTDELSSQISYMRLNPLVSYQLNENVSLGATVMIGYAQMRFAVYPNTYSPGMDGTPGTMDDFAGMNVTDLTSFGFAGRVGAQVKLGPMVRLGAMYTSESTIEMKDGTAALNFGQKVNYDSELSDFTWPQEVEAGIALTPIEGLTVAADVKWINWSATVEKPVLKLSNPEAPGVPPAMEVPFTMSWDDQVVYAMGVEYVINPMHTVRAGFNYGKNPVPDDTLNPLFPAIVESHMTLGYGLTINNWAIDLAYEHAFEKTQTNNNTNQQVNNFGPGLEVAHSQNTVSLQATYRY